MSSRNLYPLLILSFEKVEYFAVGILYFFITFFAISLLPSNLAADFPGAITITLLKALSFLKKS